MNELIPDNNLTGRQRLRNIDNPLVGAPPELEGQVLLGQQEAAINQDIQVVQKFLLVRRFFLQLLPMSLIFLTMRKKCR